MKNKKVSSSAKKNIKKSVPKKAVLKVVKKTVISSDKRKISSSLSNTKRKPIKLASKKSTIVLSSIISPRSKPSTKIALRKKVRTTSRRQVLPVSFGMKNNSEFAKKAGFKISSEFAIAVILVVAGTFGYIFWKGSSGQIFISNDSLQSKISRSSEVKIKDSDKPIEEWKVFRNDELGNEFRLPRNWRATEEEGSTFVSDETLEEIIVTSEKNSEEYVVDDLTKISLKEDSAADVKLLSGQNGIGIEKKEGNIFTKIAKILLGDDIVIATYSTLENENSGIFFEKIVPTFKTVE